MVNEFKHKGFTNTAFTLAEVLITLGIIGVVAAMTIPTVMNNIQEQQTITAIKKAYSTLSQAASMAAMDNSGTLANACSANNDHACFGNLFKNKLRVSKDCPPNSTTECWHAANQWFYAGGGPVNSNRSTGYNVVLNDGSLLSFWALNADCSNTPDTYWSTTTLCGHVYVDTNGYKKPNRLGNDIFRILFLPNITIPDGAPTIMQTGYGGSPCDQKVEGERCTYYLYSKN